MPGARETRRNYTSSRERVMSTSIEPLIHRSRSGPLASLIPVMLLLVSCSEPDQHAPADDSAPVPDEPGVVVGGVPAISAQTTQLAHIAPAIAAIPSGCLDSGARAVTPPFRGPRFRGSTTYEYAVELSGTGEVNLAGILQSTGALTGKQAAATSAGDGVTRWSFALQSTVR